MPMNIQESRVLNAVQAMGSPSTLDVAEKCGLSSGAARSRLKALEASGRIQAQGRRWAVPSKALNRLSDTEPIEKHISTSDIPGFGIAFICFLFVLALVVWGLVCIISHLWGSM